MPSDSNGNYSLPLGYLAVTGATIQASQHNPPLEDIASSLTARLMRSGVGPMTGPLRLMEGTAAAPSLTFSGSLSWGLYKTLTGVGVSISGTQVAEFGPAGVTLGLPAATVAVPGVSELASSAETVAGLVTHHITVSGGTGTFTDGETVTATGGGSGIYVLASSTSTVFAVRGGTGAFTGTLTGATSAATKAISTYAPVVTTPVGVAASLAAFVPPYPRGYIDGCILSNNALDATNDIDIAGGVCRDYANSRNINATAMTKKLDANWVAGTNQGMRNSAAGIADGWYHIWAGTKVDGTSDFYAHSSATPATVLAAWQAESGGADFVTLTHIMSIYRTGGAIKPFSQFDDEVTWKTIVNDYSNLPASTSQIARVLTVPTGIKVRAKVTGYYHPLSSNTAFVLIQPMPPFATDVAASATAFTAAAQLSQQAANFQLTVLTDTSGQIGSRVSAAATSDLLRINTVGFIHPRGKDA